MTNSIMTVHANIMNYVTLGETPFSQGKKQLKAVESLQRASQPVVKYLLACRSKVKGACLIWLQRSFNPGA